MSNRIQIYKNVSRRRFANAVGIGGAIVAVLSIAFALVRSRDSTHKLVLIAWALAPPLWFVFEYFFLFDNWDDKGAVEEFKYVESLTSKLWAAILAVLLALYAFPNNGS